MNEELLLKAKGAKNAQELMKIAEENNYPLALEDAENIFATLNREGELSDDELDAVSGGGCLEVDGKSYTVVTCGVFCFTGHYEPYKKEPYGDQSRNDPMLRKRTDNFLLRQSWWDLSVKDQCGHCLHLGLHNGVGYCEKEFE